MVWTDALRTAYSDVLSGVLGVVPNIIIALIVVIIGLLVAEAVAHVVSKAIKALKVDSALEAAGVEKAMNKMGLRLDAGKFIGEILRWFVVVVIFIAAFDILGLSDVTNFLEDVVAYLPQVFVAVLVLMVAVIVAEAVRKLIIASSNVLSSKVSNFLGTLAKWSIIIVGFMVALQHLDIGGQFIATLYTGVVVAISLALGLSFGLGGQQAASDFIEKIRGEIKQK
jgi:hypothetical protein